MSFAAGHPPHDPDPLKSTTEPPQREHRRLPHYLLTQELLQGGHPIRAELALCPPRHPTGPGVGTASQAAEEVGIPQRWKPLENRQWGDLLRVEGPPVEEGALQRGPLRCHGVLGSSRPSRRARGPLWVQEGAPTKELTRV